MLPPQSHAGATIPDPPQLSHSSFTSPLFGTPSQPRQLVPSPAQTPQMSSTASL
jgi:hypothetical protein